MTIRMAVALLLAFIAGSFFEDALVLLRGGTLSRDAGADWFVLYALLSALASGIAAAYGAWALQERRGEASGERK